MVPRMMDQTGGELLKRWCESKGVRVLTGTQVDEIKAGPQRLSLAVGNGGVLEADLVVCATGVRPNIGFLQNSGVETDLGILVDDHLRTSARDVYAAGDVAQGPVFNGGQREVHAIQPTAGDHGQVAGLNMANVDTVYGGSLAINVLNTLGLISSSFGQWQGVPGGDSASTLNEEEFKYLRLEFDGDYLVGAIGLGLTQQVGILRGLIQTRVNLGQWKNELLRDPHQIVHAYLECNTSTEAAA
jgi:NAD(P)H-nitrite reductase large subunit